MASFDPNELEIMKVLWDHGWLKPGEIQKRLSRPVKNSALRWQLGALMERGQVARRKQGKAFLYRAAAPRENVFQKLTRRLADALCGGSVVALMGQMLESQEELSEDDINELKRIARKKASAREVADKKGPRK